MVGSRLGRENLSFFLGDGNVKVESREGFLEKCFGDVRYRKERV